MDPSRKVAVPVLVSCVVTLLMLPALTSVWRLGFDKPFDYQYDALYYLASFKGLVETGGVTFNPNLGAPIGQKCGEIPSNELVSHLNVALAKLVAVVDPNPAFLLNVLFLLSFPVAAGTATYVAIRLGLRPAIAGAVGILFAFVPYHFLRGERHLYLSIYYVVPLCVLLMNDVRTRRADVVRAVRHGGWHSLPAYGEYFVFAALCGLNGIYYCLLSAILTGTVLLVTSLDTRRLTMFLSGLVYCVVMLGTLGLSASPYIVHVIHHDIEQGVVRSPSEVEKFGLTLAPIVLPVEQHGIPLMAELRQRFNTAMLPQITNENGMASVGLIGTLGFMILLCAPLVRPLRALMRRHSILSVIVYVALVWCLVGGLSAALSFALPTGMLRSLNRVSIYIAFCSLCGVGAVADELAAHWQKRGLGSWVASGMICVVVLLGTFDQCPRSFASPTNHPSEFVSDDRFGRAIDAALPAGAMIYNLPSMSFPEGTDVAIGDYDEFRPYLHTHHVRYSYGAIRGTGGDEWQSVLPASNHAFVTALWRLGFRAILIDWNYLGHNPDTLSQGAALALECHSTPIVSEDGSFTLIPILAR